MPRPRGTNYRAKQALELRDGGADLETIARELGLKDASVASQYIRRARRSMNLSTPAPAKIGQRISYHKANAA